MSALRENSANNENRAAPRERVMLAGKLSFHNGQFSASCAVMQLSATGARLSVEGDLPISEKLQLSVPQRNIERSARLVWRRGRMIGVAFDADQSAEPSAAPPKVRELEEENRRLKALLIKLEQRLKEMQEG
jgi:hypothetical protein